jgi:hypothetical protein
MSKVRVVLLGVLAACALSATAMATQASAHEYLVEGKPVATGIHIKFHGEALSTSGWLLLGTAFFIKIHIVCEHIVFLGGILPEGKSLATITFSKCKVTEPAKGCIVKEPITAKTKGELVNEPVENKFNPESGTVFTEITLENNGTETCSTKGTSKVEGSQRCKLPKAGEELLVHEILCEASGSELKFFGNAATFMGPAVPVELETKQKWSAK